MAHDASEAFGLASFSIFLTLSIGFAKDLLNGFHHDDGFVMFQCHFIALPRLDGWALPVVVIEWNWTNSISGARSKFDPTIRLVMDEKPTAAPGLFLQFPDEIPHFESSKLLVRCLLSCGANRIKIARAGTLK
jgi:hypothetical protein